MSDSSTQTPGSRLADSGFAHVPVLLQEVVAGLTAARAPESVRLIVDGTLGGGGHSSALLAACPQARLVGIDRDPAALAAAQKRLQAFESRCVFVHGCMGDVASHLAQQGLLGQVDALLADFGVSSHQLDTPGRGFSFQASGPLDMRMDPTQGSTAAELLADMTVDALADVLRGLGEERYAGRIARGIVKALGEGMPATTDALAAVVRAAVPPPRRSKRGAGGASKVDPATRTFQALRILVNDELGEVDRFLAAVPDVLAAGGRVGAISFHSLEDRRVKQAFVRAARSCVCPPELPVCACNTTPTLRLLTRSPICAQVQECEANPRARSAKLRLAQRL